MSESPAPLSYALEGDVATITMDDGKANALSHDLLNELFTLTDRAVAEAKALVLAGRPGKFCAGFDLAVMRQGPEASQELTAKGARYAMHLYTLPIPVVAACTGHALAAGAILLMASDWRIGTAGDFKIGLNEVAIGMSLPDFATTLAKERLTTTQLTAATNLATIYDPAGARSTGYLDEVADDALVAAAAKAAELAAYVTSTGFSGTRRTTRAQVAEGILARLDDDMAFFSISD